MGGPTVGTAASAVSQALSQRQGGGKSQLQAWLAGALGTGGGGSTAAYTGAAAHGVHASNAYAAVSNSRTKRRQPGAVTGERQGGVGGALLPPGSARGGAPALALLAAGVDSLLGELREGQTAVRQEMAALKAAVAANAAQQAEILYLLRSLSPSSQA